MGETGRKVYAEGAGRFYFLITKPFYHIAYLFDNVYYTKIIHYGFLLLSFILFAIVVKRVFKETAFTLSVFLLLFVFLTITPNYFIPFQALPVYFTLSFSTFLLSILQLIKYYELNRYKNLIFSVILFAVTLLFYENYLMFIFFVLVFMLAKNISEQGTGFLKNKTMYKETMPFVLVCVVYVAVYYLYRMYVQTENGFYHGTTIAKDFNFSNFLKFIWNPNKTAIPTYVYHREQVSIQLNSLLETGHQHNFWYILKNSQPISIVNTLIQCFLFSFLFSRVRPDISWKKIGTGVLTVAVFIFAVNVLMALSEKYNALYYAMDGYVTTYYSYFCIVLFIAFIAYSCLKLGYRNKYIKTTVIVVFAFLFSCISIIIGYSNEHLSRDWQHSNSRKLMMGKVIDEGIFDKIPDNSVIYLPNYNQTVSKLGYHLYGLQPDFWATYIHLKTNKKLNIINDVENLKSCIENNSAQKVYFITKYEAQKSLDILLVLSKINVNTIDFENEETAFASAVANDATVYYYSANKDFIFQFIIPLCTQVPTVTINNTEIQKISSGMNAVRIENTNRQKAVTVFTLKSDEPFLVKDFAVSNMGFLNEDTVYLYDY
jgi:hypothetical protein